MKNSSAAELIRNGRLFLGIEFGSTRIKAVLIDDACRTLAQGSHGWENRLEGGYWTYHQEEIWRKRQYEGRHCCCADCSDDLKLA